MAIRLVCECGRQLSIADGSAGKRVRCPGCGNAVEVPAPTAIEAPDSSRPAATAPPGASFWEKIQETVGDLQTVVVGRRPDDVAVPSEQATGARLGRYPLLATLGKGGMGEVLLVRDPELGRDLAAKVILGGARAGRAPLAKFLLEAQVTGQLEHPNIVPVHELGIDEGNRAYFTMKRVKGRDLEALLSDLAAGEGRQSSSTSGRRRAAGRASGVRKVEHAEAALVRLLAIFLKVLDAVAFAHSRGVIHRDLKPANVMTGEFGEVLVMDWGLAKVIGQPEV
ncbi:MAG: serine/threonine protein kinase, partial [Planctomycetes bacterium]|nr:serine/threonine protein kinase [Planctomycetota bacterium]